ncbi:MAG: proline iminopeptidase-family hydrolase [Balneolaceae bacterium]
MENIRIITIDGGYKVWTKRMGKSPDIKLLLLHGGPGATHEYFKIFDNYLPAEGIEYYYYDQLGSHHSDPANDPSLWTIERFAEEVETVRSKLGLDSSNFFLLGHSWGGILAIEYSLRYQKNLKGLIVSNMMSSIPDYNRYANDVLASGIDPGVVKEIRKLESEGKFDSERYMELLIPNFYEKHVLRIPADKWPEDVNKAFENINHEMYVAMQGPSEFGASGKLEFWDRRNDLKQIDVPTLVIGAEHDTMDPKHMKWMAEEFPEGEYLHCPEGSHIAMWDDTETYVSGLIRFLKKVE